MSSTVQASGHGFLFRDRRHAGRLLAAELKQLQFDSPVVVALPRGGVPVGYEVARALGGSRACRRRGDARRRHGRRLARRATGPGRRRTDQSHRTDAADRRAQRRDVLELNDEAARLLQAPHELALVPDAGHLFEEPGALEQVARLAGQWFMRHLAQSNGAGHDRAGSGA